MIVDHPAHMQPYVIEQMRPAFGVRIGMDFRVEHRGYSINKNPQLTPIIVNNFNRLSYLSRVIDSLRNRGYENLYVIDNNSTYEPLLDYYRESRLRVFYLNENVGYLALWRTPIYKNFTHSYYAYTDSDIEPAEDCPADFVTYFKQVLDRRADVAKVGFGLKIDDLPEHYSLRTEVIRHEMQFHMRSVEPDLYDSPIDTTMALYRPKAMGGWWLPAIRTSEPYVARHLPWYADSANPTAEERYYQATSTASTHWTQMENGGRHSPRTRPQ